VAVSLPSDAGQIYAGVFYLSLPYRAGPEASFVFEGIPNGTLSGGNVQSPSELGLRPFIRPTVCTGRLSMYAAFRLLQIRLTHLSLAALIRTRRIRLKDIPFINASAIIS
jgi:hypothetical protein